MGIDHKADIAKTAVILDNSKTHIGADSRIMDHCVIGVPNQYPNDFANQLQTHVKIGSRCVICPGVTIYEGATIGDDVTITEGCSIGSRTIISDKSRILYGAQIHDGVTIGAGAIVAGFVADNCCVGNGVHTFGSLIHSYYHPEDNEWDATDETGPTVRDWAIIGWGAILIGEIEIGERARILPNSVVRENVPPGTRYGLISTER